MPSTWPTPRVWTAGERVSASKMNELSTAFGVLFPFTTGGDLAYRDAAGAYLTRLAHVVGGLLIGGAAHPEWLDNPVSLGLLQNDSSGYPSYLTGGNALEVLRKNAANNGFEFAPAPGLHTRGNVDFSPGGQSFSGGWADITGATFDLTLTVACTVVVLAVVTGYNGTAGRAFYVRANVNGTGDPAGSFPFNGGAARNEAVPYIYYATGIPAGTRTVKLQCQADVNPNVVERGRLIALAFAE